MTAQGWFILGGALVVALVGGTFAVIVESLRHKHIMKEMTLYSLVKGFYGHTGLRHTMDRIRRRPPLPRQPPGYTATPPGQAWGDSDRRPRQSSPPHAAAGRYAPQSSRSTTGT